jgi:hypothetical protein
MAELSCEGCVLFESCDERVTCEKLEALSVRIQRPRNVGIGPDNEWKGLECARPSREATRNLREHKGDTVQDRIRREGLAESHKRV